MDAQLLLLVILIELVLAITTIAPLGLGGRFGTRPNLGIAIWFFLFFLSVLSALAALATATSFVFHSYFKLQAGSDLVQTLLISFAPWLLLAFAGVLLAITNQRLAPYFEGREAALDFRAISVSTPDHFEGVEVRKLALPGYYAIAKDRAIYLSEAAMSLDFESKRAILWHELGHLRLGHQGLKRFGALAVTLAPWFLVSRVFNHELVRLCELAADQFALRHVPEVELSAARSLFV